MHSVVVGALVRRQRAYLFFLFINYIIYIVLYIAKAI
nr:MAG TPA: hypothetical protein [Bacteriophage sp.]